jgi:hypothetical protein
MSLLTGKRVLLTTGSRTTLGGFAARAIWGIPKMLRAIRSVTATISCASIPVPATKPRSSGRNSVTGTPEGLRTPSEVAHPPSRAAARRTGRQVQRESGIRDKGKDAARSGK